MDSETVYIVRAAGTNQFKVGYTAGPISSRLAALQCGSPLPLSVHELIPTYAGATLESALHAVLKEWMIPGRREWFEIEPETLDELIGSYPIGRFYLMPGRGDSVHIALGEQWRDSDGHVWLSSSCVTWSELEVEVLDLIRSLLGLLSAVRGQRHLTSGSTLTGRAARIVNHQVNLSARQVNRRPLDGPRGTPWATHLDKFEVFWTNEPVPAEFLSGQALGLDELEDSRAGDLEDFGGLVGS